MNEQPVESSRTQARPDGTQGPPQSRPWAQWDVLARGDIIAAVLVAVATVFTAGSLFWGNPTPSRPGLFELAAPLVGAVFFVALLAMFANRERHGLARTLLAVGAAVLAVVGVFFIGEVSAARLVAFYWLPAILAMAGAIELVRTKRASHHMGEPLPVGRNPPNYPR